MKFWSALLFLGLGLPAFAQTCYVDLVNRFHRPVRTFVGYGDCYEELKECRKTVRMQPQLGGVDCVKQVGGYSPAPQPNPYPHPNPYPQPQPNPYPNPYPQAAAPASCQWYDGYSYGIAQRGWHATRNIRGISISLQYYGNDNFSSQIQCQRDLIFRHDADLYRSEVAMGATQTCGCNWYEGQSVGPRGWHMTFRVRTINGGTITLSSGFYDNYSIQSQQACNMDLVRNNFICPIRY